MVNILCLILLAFAAARLTRIVTDDSVTTPFRQWVTNKAGEDSGWTTLVHCIWCSGWWVSWAVTAALFPFLTLPWFMLPLVAIAVSQIAPMILQASDHLAFGGS